MPKIFTRAEMYKLVWAQPTRTVAADVGVSDVALAKACRRADIPIPPRGFWARTPEQRKPFQIALPPRFPGSSDQISFGTNRYGTWGPDWRKEILDEPDPPEPVFNETIESLSARVEKMVGRVPALKNFDRAFGDIAKLLSHDEERRKSAWSYDKPRYDAGIERRRLLIINSLFLAFSTLGCRGSMSTSKYGVDDPQNRGITISVGAQHISFTLEPPRPKPRQPVPDADILTLQFGSPHSTDPTPKSWSDAPGQKLESRLREVVVAVLIEAELRYRDAQVRHRQWLIGRKIQVQEEIENAKAEEARKAKERQEREERQRISRLLRQAADLQRAQTIRAYVQAICARAAQDGVDVTRLEPWASWALGEADRIDPSKSLSLLELIRGG